jgi:tetratricopeptide (TPR) repeat protein
MPPFLDGRGLFFNASLPSSSTLLDDAVSAYLGMRADTMERAAALTKADPGCVLAHCLNGYLQMHTCKPVGRTRAQEHLRQAETAAKAGVTARETLHIGALEGWYNGDLIHAIDCWEAILADFPLDVLALRLSQFMTSYLGQSRAIRDSVARVLPAWDEKTRDYGFVLSCYAYGLEEAGDYAMAEEFGRRAVQINSQDLWGIHAVTHVMEMQGRLRAGVEWVKTSEASWTGCGNFVNHLWWHCGLFHLAAGEYEAALELYDRKVSAAGSDEYLDIANAAALLWRLEQAGQNVANRWEDLADRTRNHLDEHLFVFVDLHYLVAIVAKSSTTDVQEFLDSCVRYGKTKNNHCTEAQVMSEVGLPIAQGVIAHRNREYDVALNSLLPVQDLIHRIGGSHAQRDLFEQMLADSAIRANQLTLARLLLEKRIEKRPADLWAWRSLASLLDRLHDAQGAAASHAAMARIMNQ